MVYGTIPTYFTLLIIYLLFLAGSDTINATIHTY